ncbi:hypothetical protein [Chroococcidiopsis thermalis]|uniref:hypothetical protein n=1 Tax=Chroococcidiopsis thermalis TaxID=54299 RepID=UPI0002D6D41B|nr:hypothetical protein [Chroococcidiopsis thermalis]PSB42374.1 hypothetical protein C7B80_27680 [Cyanosarcina cf. burmensis CCALA 770]
MRITRYIATSEGRAGGQRKQGAQGAEGQGRQGGQGSGQPTTNNQQPLITHYQLPIPHTLITDN